uniref:Uncharacterized protein n=1 Tax=Myoviridae sp. ctUPB15 TaxID=2825116 RepID=A0A8S5PWE4_9CAUD|nr:MAG TPA: hypothetical protein [Myoviridae sp. ctUPB15]
MLIYTALPTSREYSEKIYDKQGYLYSHLFLTRI